MLWALAILVVVVVAFLVVTLLTNLVRDIKTKNHVAAVARGKVARKDDGTVIYSTVNNGKGGDR